MNDNRHKAMLYAIGMSMIIFVTVATIPGSSDAQCISGLTNYWKLDESSGGMFVDSIGGADANCSTQNCPQFSDGIIGNALMFDGINSGIDVSPHASFNWGNPDSFSIDFWMKTDPTSTCSGNHQCKFVEASSLPTIAMPLGDSISDGEVRSHYYLARTLP